MVTIDAAEELVRPLLLLEQLTQEIGAVARPLTAVALFEPELHRRLEFCRALLGLDCLCHSSSERLTYRLRAEQHTETVLRVVLEQGIRPCRTAALLVLRVRDGRRTGTPNGGAARCIGDHHAVAEELRDELGIRCLAAACTRARELEERLLELRADQRCLLHRNVLDRNLRRIDAVVKVFLRVAEIVVEQGHVEGLARADLRTVAAAEAVERRDGDGEVHPLRGTRLHGLHPLRCRSKLLVRRQDRADRRMRADKGALVALDALLGAPYGNGDRRTTLFVRRAAHGERAVLHAEDLRDLELVALLAIHDVLDVRDERRCLLVDRHLLVHSILPSIRNMDAVQRLDALVDRTVVHVDDLLALAAVGGDNRILEILDRIIERNDVGELEERRLHDHVEASAKAEIARDVNGIHRIELNVVACDEAAHRCGQMRIQLLIRPERIEQERTALPQPCEQVVLPHIGLLRTGDKVRTIDEIRADDRRLAEAQVAHRDAARLLRVIGKVRLRIHIRLVADDFDRALVRADRAVRAEPPELARRRPLLREVDITVNRRQAAVRYIIDDAERKAVHRRILLQLLVDAENLIRRRILAAETVAAADDDGIHA